ncbi:MAG: DUF1269 domain-containing protein [Geminicoccaceae bacterium]
MSDLIVIGFDSQESAENVRQKMVDMQKSYLVDLEDAVVAVKQEDGKIKLNQMHNLATVGALSGSFWGLLIGLIFLNPLLGAAAGAAAGGISGALSDIGINDDFMREVSEVLQPGSAALFVLTRKVTGDKMLAELEGVGGTVLRTSLSNEDEAKLREAIAAVRNQDANA